MHDDNINIGDIYKVAETAYVMVESKHPTIDGYNIRWSGGDWGGLFYTHQLKTGKKIEGPDKLVIQIKYF